MELNVTQLMNRSSDMKYYAGSCAELGEEAGRITWDNAMDCVGETALIETPEEIQTCKEWLREFGAWEAEEIQAWTDQQVNALLLQMIAGDVRSYLKAEEEGRIAEYLESEGGSLYRSGNDWYYYVGH